MALDALLADADVVSLHVKLTDDSRHLIDAPALARMKDDAILLNGARGDVIDMEKNPCRPTPNGRITHRETPLT